MGNQGLQTLLSRWLTLVIQTIELECLHQRGDIPFCRENAYIIRAIHESWHEQSGQHTHDDHDDHDFDQRKTGMPASSAGGIACKSHKQVLGLT